MSEEFILVKTKKISKKSRKLKNLRIDRSSSPVEIDVNKVFSQIKNIKSELENSEFLEKSLQQLQFAVDKQQVNKIICLGIGRVSECVIAKHQLAFISIIKEKINIQEIEFYDPVQSESDKTLLERLNYDIIAENKEGKYLIEQPTLIYLPHCPRQITNNLLYSNWNAESLSNITLICNSFKTIIENTPERLLRPNAHFLIEIHPFVDEVEIDNLYKFNDIFNDFSILTFRSEKIKKIPPDFWKTIIEPIYSEDNLEFVRNDGGS